MAISSDQLARTSPEELIFNLLASGFNTECYDGQNFFDTEHPLHDDTGNEIGSVSNMQAGAGLAWFLLDTSRAVRPIVWQEREKYEFEALDKFSDPNVFFNNESIYGVRARVNAGFGLWQLAFGSKDVLALKGAGLVHHPNLTLTARPSQETSMDDERPFTHHIAKRLGLADGASMDEIVKALEDVLNGTPDPEKCVPVEALQACSQIATPASRPKPKREPRRW